MATAETIEERLAKVDEQIALAPEELAQEGEQEAPARLFETVGSATKLPPELSRMEQRKARLERALQEARALAAQKDEDHRMSASDAQGAGGRSGIKGPAQQRRRLCAELHADGDYGWRTRLHRVLHAIRVDTDVITNGAEATVQSAAVERIAEDFGKRPRTVMGDGPTAPDKMWAHSTNARWRF